MEMRRLCALVLTAFPVSLVGTLSWFGVFTFVNAYLTTGLGYTAETWTAVTLWFTGGMIVWPLLCTEISARIGRRKTVVLGMLAVSLFYFLIACTSNLIAIRLLLAMIALLQGTNSIAWLPMVAEYGRDYPGRAFAVMQLVGGAVATATLLFGGMLLAKTHYHDAFLYFGAVCALCTLAFWFSSRAMEAEVRCAVVSLRQVSRADLLRLFTGPFVILLLLGICMEPFNYHTANQLYPNLARDVYHLSNKHISMVVALGRLPAIVTLFVIAHVIDRLNVVRCYGAGLCATGVCIVAMGLAQGHGLLIAGFFAYYLCHGSVWGTNLAAINRVVSSRLRDSAFALMSVIMTCAVFVVGIVHNRLLAAGVSLPHVFTYCGAVAFVAGLCLVGYSFSRHLAQHPTPAALAEGVAEV